MTVEKKQTVFAVILAAGSGTRMRSEVTKQRMDILGKSVLERTVEAFEEASEIDGIIVVAKEDELDFVRSATKRASKLTDIVLGGRTRAESAKNGFMSIKKGVGAVMIHDGARCLITPEAINEIARAVRIHGAATAAARVTDTVKVTDKDGMITATVPREGMLAVQTPQAFSCDLYRRALEDADVLSPELTDDNMLVERLGVKIYPVLTECENIKITAPLDMEYAEFIIKKRQKL